MIWAACNVEDDHVVVRVTGWRKVLATKGELVLPLASIVRVDHEPLARGRVKTGLRQWRKHGSGVWRLGVYHGLDGWSFWSIGLGRNAVLIECSGERFRFVVIEVADAPKTVREIRTAVARATQRIPGGMETGAVGLDQRPGRRDRRGQDQSTAGQD